MVCLKTFFAVIILALPMMAVAEQMPLPKQGGCPLGSRESGSFCVSGSDSRTQAIPKVGSTCPAGWITSGNYCTRPTK